MVSPSPANHILLSLRGSHQIVHLLPLHRHSAHLLLFPFRNLAFSSFLGREANGAQWKGILKQRVHNNGLGKVIYKRSDSISVYVTSCFSESGSSNRSRPDNTETLFGQGSMASKSRRRIPKAPGSVGAELSTLAGKVAEIEHKEELASNEEYEHSMSQIKGAMAQARLRATFYPKFENEKSDQEIRSKMIDVVHSGIGVLEVTLKHSGSLFMYAGDNGGAFAKNSFGNLYSAVGVFVLGRTLQEAWGVKAAEKQREFNAFLEKNRICISMELVTAVLGDHGQRPLKDYVVVTAVTELVSKPRFYSTPDLIAFCRKWRLPTNHVWLFSSRKSAASFFTAFDALCEEGTASSVSNIMDQIADISVPATKSHMEVQGEILEGLVARIVSPHSTERLRNVLQEFPPVEFSGQTQVRPTLREICAAHKASEEKQVKALLQNIGSDMCSDWSDWNSSQADPSLLKRLLNAAPADQMTVKLQEMIRLLQERHMQVRYPCRVKGVDKNKGKIHFKLTLHVLNDSVFRRYQKEMRDNPGLWPLYRGFFVDVCLSDTQNQVSSKASSSAISSLSEEFHKNLSLSNVEDDALADEAENLMLKLKFLTYKLRTFLIRNGLSTLFNSGFAAYRKYYLRLMEIWGTSSRKQRQLDQLLTEWAGYITKKCHGKKLNERIYLSEAEPFLQQFAERGVQNRQLVGSAGTIVRTEDFLADLALGSHVEDDEDVRQLNVSVDANDLSKTSEAKGMLVFFPGIPGCAKSALCRELLKTPGGLGDGKPLHSLMGDMIKGRYWPKLAEERKRNPSIITLADKNAPNEEVWKTVEDMCRSTSALGVPVVPDSEGTVSNPFSLEVLAVFIYRVLQRVNHPGNLDSNSPNAGYVLLMFYNLYEGKDRREFEESLKRRFGYLVKQPVLRAERAAMPPPVIVVLTKGLDLFRRHAEKHGRMESTKGSFREEWSRWEKRLREILFGNAEYLKEIQVPFEESVQSVQEQLQAIAQGDTSMHISVERERTFNTVTYAAVSLPPAEIVDILNKVSMSNKDVQNFLVGKGIDTKLKAAHVTLAHKVSHGIPAVAAYGELRGLSVPVQLTAFLFSKKMCALEAHIDADKKGVLSKNEWPHVTVWTAEGTRPKEANSLPQLVSQGQACRLNFSTPFVISGVIDLL